MSDEKNVFRATSYAGLGILSTRHGSTILQHILEHGQTIRCGLIVTDDPKRLMLSKPFLSTGNWWKGWKALKILWAHRACRKWISSSHDVDKIYLKHRIPFLFVPDFGSQTATLASATGADAALLLEAPIIRGPILTALPQGIVNFHAAPLPAYRGNFVTWWALYHNDPLALTVHCIRHGVDDGPILFQKPVPVFRKDTLQDIDARAIEVAAKAALEVVREGHTGWQLTHQEPWQGRLFKGSMPADIVTELEHRLAEGSYGHYVDA